MSIDLHFFKLAKTRDAIAIYAFLVERGDLGKTSYERLALDLNAAGLATSRGADFTAAVVRSKIAELLGIGALTLEKVSKNAFRLDVPAVQNNDANVRENATVSKEVAPVAIQNETVEQTVESPRARGEVVIINNINNKKINKTTSEISEIEKMEPSDVQAPAVVVQPSTDGLRKRIDWQDPKIAAFRASIVRQCWEPGINPDLIDRVAALAILKIGGYDAKRVAGLLRAAQDARSLYERSNGRSGNPTLWKTLCFSVKRVYEGARWRWTPTRIANEPEPTSTPIVAVRQGMRNQIADVEKEASSSSRSEFVYSDEECFGDFDRLAQIVARREGLGAVEAKGRAYAIRLERRDKVPTGV